MDFVLPFFSGKEDELLKERNNTRVYWYYMRIRTLSIIALLCFSVLSGAFLVVTERSFSPLRVIFLDVGQGDAILISQEKTSIN